MNIKVNGKRQVIDQHISILDFLNQNKINKDSVAVELNRKIICKDDYSDVSILENDVLEILRIMGGG